MVKLRVSPALVRQYLLHVQHATYRKGLSKYWRVESDGTVPAQSVCWLFCWAKTGMGNDDAMQGARASFDAILDTPFAVFDAHVPHEWAQEARYSEYDLEEELERYLTSKPEQRRRPGEKPV